MDSIFKQTLRSEMDFQDIRVKELASKTGISQRTLEGYLSSRGSIPPADVAVKIASALNVSVEYLVTGKNADKNLAVNNIVETFSGVEKLSIEKRLLIKEFILMLNKFDIGIEKPYAH